MKIEQYLKNFEYPDQTILDSTVYADLPEHFVTLKAIWGEIKAGLQSHMCNLPPDEREDFFDAINFCGEFKTIEEFFIKSCWGWKPSGRKVKFSETDRFGQHFYGAMYTSKAYPWPMHDDIPYLPYLQIDLDKAGALIDARVGDGFLQLFQAPRVDEIDSDDWHLLIR